ncbi:hypothetical protein DRQ25_01620 [Candidatus Fermentibacteria bacterium]|nr:MAG: hypothetical protein DRQ25_01620 [Candidatus Fermentibacteria bacterium]
MSDKGLDIGTNMLVAASVDEDGSPIFKMQRDAFYRIVPKSEVNKNSIRMSLEKRGANFITENDTFVVVGEDALEIAIERNDVAKRPLRKGIISPREKDSLPMLKLLIESLINKGDGNDTVVYSVPAKPIDTHFDIIYHTEIMGMYLNDMGYKSFPINEAFAICLSELLDEGLSGVAISFGAGMVNVAVVLMGEPLVEFSLTRSGDFIDTSVGNALDISPSLVQLEKEAGVDLFKSSTKIMEAVSVYYSSVITYTLQNMIHELNLRKKELPVFRDPVPIIVSGGLSKATGFVRKTEAALAAGMDLPFKISEVRKAENPMTAVANGCFLASQL